MPRLKYTQGGVTRPVTGDVGSGAMFVTESYAPKGYQQLTSITAATALTVPAGARVAIIQAESKDVRWRDDGTNPTGTVGMLIPTGQAMWYTGNLAAFKAIQASNGAILNVTYYG